MLFIDLYRPSPPTRKRAFYGGFGSGFIYFNKLNVLNGDGVHSHVAGHAATRQNPLRGRVADGTGGALAIFLTVGGRSAAETVTLNNALKTLALRDAGYLQC